MDSLDYFIVILGVALIVIGLYLFVAGKRDSANGNQVEGFGIKLNVSNPSIILIVFGIGLVLVPRLLPNNKPNGTNTLQMPKSVDNAIEDIVNVPPNNNSSANNVFFPQGIWYITQYEENGINLSQNIVQGSINFDPSANGRLKWVANLSALDAYGNVLNYQYSGTINTVLGGYNISVLNSNDPSFSRESDIPLILKMDNSNSLHMEYRFNGSAIILHWSK